MTDWEFFRHQLLDWYRPERRPMPWKEEKDPYRIWLSEIILQQTRVQQGRPYYEKFVAAFPTVGELAAADDDRVMKLWEGLGYYSRARNLLRAARMVAADHDGRFPDTYAGLRELPGVGPYTAAAIASFAFDRPVAVLDGNVYRILSRYANDATPIDTGRSRAHYQSLVDRALGEEPAARFNQAIMDFGALVCTPKAADCPRCPLAPRCAAYAAGTVYELPVKSKKIKRRNRFFHYLVIRDPAGRTLVGLRGTDDIWAGLYDFPLAETTTLEVATGELPALPTWPDWLPAGELKFVRRSSTHRHQLTHQTIGLIFHVFDWPGAPDGVAGYNFRAAAALRKLAFPRVINHFFDANTLTLDL